jgi:hypothetical protein
MKRIITQPVCHPEAMMPPYGVSFAACGSVWKRCGSHSLAKAMISCSVSVREPYSQTLAAGKSSQ